MAKSGAERVAEHRQRQKAREAAIELGRRYGEDEADKRGEIDDEREDRIQRAVHYQLWDLEGRPVSSGGRKVSGPDFLR